MPENDNQNADALSTDTAAELAGHIARLAKTGLPLAPGLRALAGELRGRQLSRALRRIAARLESGGTMEDAMDAMGPRFPAHIRGLIVAGIRSGNLATVLEELVELEHYRTELRRRVWLIFAYPVLLITLLLGLFAFMQMAVAPDFIEIFEDFDAELPPMTQLVCSMSGPVALIPVGGLVAMVVSLWLLWILPGPVALDRLMHLVPLVGPVRRWSGLVRFSRLLGLLLEQEIPLPEALRLTALGVRDVGLAAGCRSIAAEVESGRPLSESLTLKCQFHPSLIPFVEWGQKTAALPEAFRAAGEMFACRVHVQAGFLDVVILPFVLLLFLGTIPLIMTALFMPLIKLINTLC